MSSRRNNVGSGVTVPKPIALLVIAVAVLVAVVRGGGLGSGLGLLSGTTGSGSGSQATASQSAEGTTDAPTSQVSAAKKGTLEFRSEERLERHFRKHGSELGYDSADDYVAGANKVVANSEALHKEESEDGDDVYFLEDTGELVVVSKKGYLRTYFSTDLDYFERQ